MALESIAPISPIESSVGLSNLNSTGGFDKVLEMELQEVNHRINTAEQKVRELAVGEAENLHQVMIAISKAKTSFDLAVQVRNKVVEGVQEMMRMSI